MRLIVGLGNPDPEYQWTPHNLGFMAVDELANRSGIRVERPEGKALVGRGKMADEEGGTRSSGGNDRRSRGRGGDDPDSGHRRGDDQVQPAETGRSGRAGRKVETILPGCVPGVNGKRSSWKSVITIWFLSCGRRRRKTRSRKSSRSSSTPARKK